jgi:hypothetical protein
MRANLSTANPVVKSFKPGGKKQWQQKWQQKPLDLVQNVC